MQNPEALDQELMNAGYLGDPQAISQLMSLDWFRNPNAESANLQFGFLKLYGHPRAMIVLIRDHGVDFNKISWYYHMRFSDTIGVVKLKMSRSMEYMHNSNLILRSVEQDLVDLLHCYMKFNMAIDIWRTLIECDEVCTLPLKLAILRYFKIEKDTRLSTEMDYHPDPDEWRALQVMYNPDYAVIRSRRKIWNFKQYKRYITQFKRERGAVESTLRLCGFPEDLVKLAGRFITVHDPVY